MLRTVNRVVLTLAGLALVAVGGVVLAMAADLPSRLGVGLPTNWSWQGPDSTVLSRADRLHWQGESWWWPVVIGALALLVVLALWWLLAQLRRRRLGTLGVDTGDGQSARLRAGAVEDVLTAEAESLPGVERARFTLVGRRAGPAARVGLLIAPQARPRDVVHTLRDRTLENARVSAGAEELPAEIRLRATRHAADRVN
ncbi:alkaline shock response membrane anchor protein AmaP [Streptomyces spiramenti]|uniref:Alkaline shock response membrane anchor protein AmaP n=1 Tax=Streptomyces spiramenti TaxID=2720606 RepID=A0ABX1AVA9_9ACTN|nr:alkaline shock response membrane anchor protein AmaP [Streptomyces spiramenti]NJP68955.1 alkaline shock response membrane anchor protein AmaP [Streptomyces spiramenti]